MGFLAALFLSYMPEEDAFFMFRALMQDAPHRLCDLYAPGLPKVGLLEHTLQGLLNRTMPKLAAHMHGLGLHPTMYAAQWFLTIFTYNFPFAVGEQDQRGGMRQHSSAQAARSRCARIRPTCCSRCQCAASICVQSCAFGTPSCARAGRSSSGMHWRR